jgi:hypothetical protein
MANTFELVGSPLGLFTLKSRPTRDGMSSFNGGESRNINVNAYNTGRDQPTRLRNKDGDAIESPVSLFSGGTLPNFWANIQTTGTDLDPTGTSREYSGFSREDLHNDDVYDTSLLNIIEKLSSSEMAALRPQDFAYLKNVGVFPNNRLMIARRFLSPVKDNIVGKSGTPPKSILISWKPENEDFLDIDFGEQWVDAEADFSNVLNSLGGEFTLGGSGTGLDKALNLIPLPGFTEQLRRDFLSSIGILDKDSDDSVLPSGNPNIIKEAKRRKTISPEKSGSGLKCTVSIKMVVEYEQKFISGIDPTIAWMDIISNILVFGTSKSTNYGLSDTFRGKIDTWTSNPSLLINDIFKGLSDSIGKTINNIKEALVRPAGGEEEENNEGATENEESIGKKALKKFSEGLAKLTDNSDKLLKSVKKYKVEIMGIANALSGAPSTPWHITIGNPLRPVFCSGDMYTEDVKLKLGSTLAFNDLPSNIKVEFTLKNARPWGLQEIMAKFNTGHLRTVNIQKDFLEVDGKPGGFYFTNPDSSVESEGAPEGSETSTSVARLDNIPFTPQTKENIGPVQEDGEF